MHELYEVDARNFLPMKFLEQSPPETVPRLPNGLMEKLFMGAATKTIRDYRRNRD